MNFDSIEILNPKTLEELYLDKIELGTDYCSAKLTGYYCLTSKVCGYSCSGRSGTETIKCPNPEVGQTCYHYWTRTGGTGGPGSNSGSVYR